MAFLLLTASVQSITPDTTKEGDQGKVWQIISASDTEVSEFIQKRPKKPTITKKDGRLSIRGICNNCMIDIKSKKKLAMCTRMYCGSQADKAEKFVMGVLEENGAGFAHDKQDASKIVVHGKDDRFFKIEAEGGQSLNSEDGGDLKKSGRILSLFVLLTSLVLSLILGHEE